MEIDLKEKIEWEKILRMNRERRDLSPQELLMLGASTTENYHLKFYTPLAVQEGENIAYVNDRRTEYSLETFSAYWVDENGRELPLEDMVRFVLSPLDLNTGETLEDPKPVNEKLRLNPEYSGGLKLRK